MSDRRTNRNEPSDTQKMRTLASNFFRDYPILDTPPEEADDTSTDTEEQS